MTPPGIMPPEADEALRPYVQAKLAISDLLRETKRALYPLDGDDSGVDELLSRLAEDRFHLVVLGEFKRGKSSLINAILGRALLPTAAVPLTSVVTAVRYGPLERASILRARRRFREAIPPDALADFVTERGNPSNVKGIASVEVEAPAAFLKRGLHLVDTPGVGSAHAESTAITRAFLPAADAAVFVTSAEAPLSRSELSFLDTVRSYVRRVFFVVNKMDVIDPAERAEVVRFVESALAERVGIDRPRVYPLSARLALEAKTSGASVALAASGLPALESALADFLSRERRQVFLAAILDRTLCLVDAGRFALELRRKHAAPGNDASKDELARRLEAVEAARRNTLDEARAELAAREQQVLEPALARFATSAQDDLSRTLPDAGAHGQLDAEAYYERLTRWSRRTLAERAADWEREHCSAIDAVARGVSDRLGAALAAIVAKVGREAAEALAVAPPPPSDAEEATWRRPAAPFEPKAADALETAHDPAAIPPILPGPAVLGRHIARWLVRRAVPSEVGRTADRLRERVHSHLEARIREVDIASGRAMAHERDRLGVAPLDAARAARAGGAGADGDAGRLDRLAQRLMRLREAILAAPDGAVPPDAFAEAEAAPQPRPSGAGSATPRPRDWARSGACLICNRVLDALFDFLSHFQYALATDPQTQAEFRNAGGFCPLHAWQLEELSSPRGLSGGFPALLERTGERLRALAACAPGEAGRLVLDLLAGSSACAACRTRGAVEEEEASALSAELATEAGRARYGRARGLCLNHLALLLPRVTPGAAHALLRHQGRRCDDVSEALRAYALKFDAHRQELLSRDELAAYREAVILLTGERRVF
jgi:GTP-binding protein EngB required for normal cell division